MTQKKKSTRKQLAREKSVKTANLNVIEEGEILEVDGDMEIDEGVQCIVQEEGVGQ